MINQIIHFSIQNKLIIALFTLCLIVTGIWSLSKIPLDAVPDITNNQVQVITQAPNLATEDIEQFVTYPVELAMANLTGVKEIRSISRFGLSVVTIVFEDDMGTYLPRQLVSEKLREVEENIPKGFGTPSMGPISSGLGEIYQYTLEVSPEMKDEYSTSDLRTIQDWLIRRQMAMIPGVVEINAFGGDIKQYEIAVDTDELKAIGLTITDVFTTLEKNNQNTGGAYIEKDHYANFIRGEGLARSLKDIEDMVIQNQNGLPITIKDVAKVRYGKAVRYGAFTKDGQGEAVGGMVLMFKGANSNEVIQSVKERVAKIQKSLPKGITIEPFIDRSVLIEKTTSTVSQNLMEGALIVVFILVLLLGNWRGGLIVASTIPLALLFAFIMMRVFGVWANLMSLGAIDFGIIIDGAVIIVESTVFLLHNKLSQQTRVTQQQRDELTYKASSNMMSVAFFGQLIILIVFIPILALQGVEGKMFQPMALTFMFAMLGVMILCLTYVPMMSAWLLSAKKENENAWGHRFISWVERKYEKILLVVLKRSTIVLSAALILLGVSIWLFSRMGGEFMPQLDEGDIAFHIILKPGSSLTEGIHTSTQIESILMNEFPEVEHAMTRFGVAEVPTDPMPMDIGDCFVLLKPQSEWVSAKNKEELIQKIKRRLNQVPGISYEFTQPIEMRFNELLSGVREDVAIELYGEDLDILANKAEEIGKIISTIQGVGDMKVEATSGLPQMTVQYNRNKLAQYGLQIEELNTILQAGFAGRKVGVIFEGEKRFDLVVRLDEQNRKSIDDLRNLYINLSNGSQIPFKEIAQINYQSAPMQISRENTSRRTYVGVNVRGRDTKSLVKEIDQKLDAQLKLPAGYYIRYGGAFENLERATERLQIVVPAALGLIFILIFFALRSLSQTIMIYIAIPLATIGGIFSLWLRDMPFSISAGVGFIVLFGVAVLNGLVLINGWKELKEEGIEDLELRIRLGTKRRIRPILLTALTDILGFLPMAISQSAGAEIQRPLATVVIGGMISATILTLFVLPILYRWVETQRSSFLTKKAFPLGLLILIFPIQESQAQETQIITSVEQALELAKENNHLLQSIKLEGSQLEQQRRGSFNPENTSISLEYGQINSYEMDASLTVEQQIAIPKRYRSQYQLANENLLDNAIEIELHQNQLRKEIKQYWYQLAYLYEKQTLLEKQKTLYENLPSDLELRLELQEISPLEKDNLELTFITIQKNRVLIDFDIKIAEEQLSALLQSSTPLHFQPTLQELIFPEAADVLGDNPIWKHSQQQIAISNAELELEKSKMLPDISLGYFNQSMVGSTLLNGDSAQSSDRFMGIQIGLSVPLFYRSIQSSIQAANLEVQKTQTLAMNQEFQLQMEYKKRIQEAQKQQSNLQFYQEQALPIAHKTISEAQTQLENEAIGIIEYYQKMNQALEIQQAHLQALQAYNQSIIDLEFILGQSL
jgi:heavy metal efflux system protein